MRWLRRVPNRVDRVIIVAVAAVGVLLPWAVALGVKVYLQALGKPTWPWSDIGAYAIFFGPLATPIAAAPLLALAILYRRWAIGALPRLSRATPLQARLVLIGGFAGGAAGMVHVFVGLFWEFDPMILWFMPEAVALCLPWLAGGLAAGALLAAAAGRWSALPDKKAPGSGA